MFPQDSAFAIKNINNPMFLVDFICTNLPLKKDEKIELLRIDALRARTYRLLEILNREVQLAEIKESIQMRAREDIDQQQREYFSRLKPFRMNWVVAVRSRNWKKCAKKLKP